MRWLGSCRCPCLLILLDPDQSSDSGGAGKQGPSAGERGPRGELLSPHQLRDQLGGRGRVACLVRPAGGEQRGGHVQACDGAFLRAARCVRPMQALLAQQPSLQGRRQEGRDAVLPQNAPAHGHHSYEQLALQHDITKYFGKHSARSFVAIGNPNNIHDGKSCMKMSNYLVLCALHKLHAIQDAQMALLVDLWCVQASWPSVAPRHSIHVCSDCLTLRFDSTTKVLAEHMMKYYGISKCVWTPTCSTARHQEGLQDN